MYVAASGTSSDKSKKERQPEMCKDYKQQRDLVYEEVPHNLPKGDLQDAEDRPHHR